MNDIFELEEKFQPYLLEKHYTVVSPKDHQLFSEFIQMVSNIAPSSVFTTIHHSLSNRDAVKKALTLMPKDTELCIQVILSSQNSQMIINAELSEYIKNNNIDFNI